MLAELVKELRGKTGAGFLDCKKALLEANNDLIVAVEILRKKGIARATKKFSNIAAEGVVQTALSNTHAVIFELNSQTDFVANNSEFKTLAHQITIALLAHDFKSVIEARALQVQNETINDLIIATSAKIGEKINLRRATRIALSDYVVGAYTHVNKRVAAIVVTNGGTSKIARNVAMHVASMNPRFLDAKSVPADQLELIKAEIAASPLLQSKPNKVRANIAAGMLRKKLSTLTLVDQEFVMEKISVANYLKQNGAQVLQMFRYELGDGIEKVKTDFGAEVAMQIKK